ncbi:MAG TPA: bifunctional phosphopantothenoylcysteine decarboxylase/phosphopantothenate synthase [Sphingomonadaceae bacterium]
MTGPRILLVVGGGIAAYKSCELVRLIRKGGGDVTCVLTDGGAQFVTPMTLAALSENKVYSSLWDLKDEAEMGHIQLSREADLVVVCPATADLMAKMAAGIADDLGTTLILATDKPVLAIPAMNVRMWEHEATQRNVERLRQAGVTVMQPDEGEMACGEFGPGRLPEPEMIWLEIADALGLDPGTAGPQEIGAYLEALEPEDETAELEEEAEEEEGHAHRGGLGGLLASLITRSHPRKARAEEVEHADEFPADAIAAMPFAEELQGEAFQDAGLDEVTAVPDLSNPLFAKKGKARSAPPTDAEALNHTVRTGAGGAAPEPAEGAAAERGGPVEEIVDRLRTAFDIEPRHRPLKGKHVLVTAGPTREPIDPVRYLANRSSGKQGFAIAAAAAALGARVTLIAGPVHLATPAGVDRVDVESAREMADAVKEALPADVAVMVAAVADWRVKDAAPDKLKKRGSAPPALVLTENPDILAMLAADTRRPQLLVGFAAETENLIENAKKKRKAKGVDWIVANDVAGEGAMGADSNTVHLVTARDVEDWEPMPKEDVALKLMEMAADALK